VTTTDPTLRRLLAAVLADPADDTARLIYADCLEEAGDWQRAEFIRVQCRLWRAEIIYGSIGSLPPVHFMTAGERDSLKIRERQLLAVAEEKHWAPYPVFLFAPKWQRGFVSEVRCTLSDFERHAAALFAAQPIERVVLTDKRPLREAQHHAGRSEHGGWVWACEETEDAPPWRLPSAILGAMTPRPVAYQFQTEQAALDALSAALVTHGRRLARIDVPCDYCDGTGRTMLGKVLNTGASPRCLKCGGTGWVLNTGE
jgi:uncharacterized protein (TIGR02996 family)